MKPLFSILVINVAAGLLYSTLVRSEEINSLDTSSEPVETRVDTSDILPEANIFDAWFLRSTASEIITNASLINTSSKSEFSNSSLHDLITSSLENNDLLRASLHDASAAHENLNAAKFSLLPELSLNADIGRKSTILSGSANNVDTAVKTGSINLNWTVFNSGGNWASIKAAKYSAHAADMNYLAEERRNFLEALGVYLQVLASQKLISSFEETKSRMRKILKTTQKQYKVGFASRTDVEQVKSEIASINSQLEQAKQAYDQNKIMWVSISGKKVGLNLQLPQIVSLIPSTKKAAVDKALKNNPNIVAADYSSYAAIQQSKVAKAKYLPRVSIYGNLETELDSGSYISNDNEWNAGVKLHIPLVNFAAISQYKLARQNELATRYRARDRKRQIVRDVETNWSNLQSYKRQKSILSVKLQSSRNIVRGMKKEVGAGLRPVGDLLREEILQTENQINYFQNDINKIASAYRIAIHFPDLSLNDLKL